MNKQKLLALFDSAWLPVLLLLSTTWLYAPWLHHVTPQHVAVISAYEAPTAAYSWLFRVGDIAGALLILIVIWRSRLFSKQRWLAVAILVVAVLSIIDDVFVTGCGNICTPWGIVSTQVHDIESVISVLILATVTGIDAVSRKTVFSKLFFAAQVIAGIALVLPFVNRQYLIVAQYVYEVVFVAWIAYMLQRFMPPTTIANRLVIRLRTTMAILVFVGGLLELLLAFHLRSYGRFFGNLLHGEPVWLAEHGVVISLIMFYMARYIYKGERRAAIIIGLITGTLLVKYALLTPNAGLLAFGELMALVLWTSWRSFNRNVSAPPLLSKLYSLAIVLSGVVIAGALLYLLAFATGRSELLTHDLLQQSTASVAKIERASDRQDRLRSRIAHTRDVSTGLGIATVALTLFVLFQPSSRKRGEHAIDAYTVVDLLNKYANSSEDYFKLWPHDKSYFSVPDIDGFIAYKKVSNTAFALADPICAPGNQQQLVTRFVEHCRSRGWSACFLVASEPSLPMYKHAALSTLQIGSNAIITVNTFAESTVRSKWWRWQLNRAGKAGMYYESFQPPHSSALLAETRQLSDAWLGRAGHGEQGFALGYYNEAYLQQCTLHLLRSKDGQLVAFTNQLPVYNHSTQTTVDLIRFQPDVNGAMPVLIANVILQLQQTQEFQTFDLGFVPLAKVDTTVATIARRLSAGRFSAAGLEQFKDKFKPDWHPQYLAYDGDLIDLAVLFSRLQKALSVT